MNLNTLHAQGRAALHRHWHASPAQRLWHAWRDELLGLLPERWRQRLTGRMPLQVLHWPLDEPADPTPARVLVLPRSEVLVQTLTLPLAAARDLQNVLGFELDKYTPYRADQVSFCAQVLGQGGSTLKVRLVVILRQRLEQILAECAGFTLLGVDVRDGERLGVNLLPEALRPKRERGGRLNRGLLLACAGLLLTLMVLWLQSRDALLIEMQAQVRQQQAQIGQLQQVRDTLANTQGAAHYLIARKAAQPALASLIADLSHCLPDGTWLEQLEVDDGGQVTLAGQSTQASALIGQLKQCHSLDDPQFQGVIQPDGETGKDRFSLRAHLHQEASHASSAE
ncbi:PilN domain-containing protein [Pseudomonas sp.]|uniref:PilN domain-containing protein n=1 Tax=Pseudomonas sp. TaxID=306 RepID=UPI003CC644DC